MSDVTAVVLSIGESYTERAVKTVREQSYPAKEIIVVRDISPVHRALNHAVSKVRTPYFLQVDSDMVLARRCIADLRAAIADNIGIVMGALSDPLMGLIMGVKLFRTELFRKIRFRDVISSDRTLYRDMEQLGYRRVNILGRPDSRDRHKKVWHSFGRHEPDYTTLYTYAKFCLLGRRLRTWHDRAGLQWRFRQLQHCGLAPALIAQIAMAHGIFSPDHGDGLCPYSRSEDFDFLLRFLASDRPSAVAPDPVAGLISGHPERDFQRCYELGAKIAGDGAPDNLKRILSHLYPFDEESSWIPKVGLCHGLFAAVNGNHDPAGAFAALADFDPQT